MKRSINLISILLLCIIISCSEKGDKVPKLVADAFNEKFAGATDVAWIRESDTEWEVEFEMAKLEYTAAFNADGTWLETEKKVEIHELPQNVMLTLSTQYERFKADEAELVETAEGRFYEIELENDSSEIEVRITPEGTVLKSEAAEDDDEDNEGGMESDDEDASEDDT